MQKNDCSFCSISHVDGLIQDSELKDFIWGHLSDPFYWPGNFQTNDWYAESLITLITREKHFIDIGKKPRGFHVILMTWYYAPLALVQGMKENHPVGLDIGCYAEPLTDLELLTWNFLNGPATCGK